MSGERTFYFLTGLLYSTFIFFLRLPKYDWLFLCSATRVKQNVVERNRHEVQAVPAEMQTGIAVYVADMGKNSSVRIAKMRPPNERMHRDHPVVHLTITE